MKRGEHTRIVTWALSAVLLSACGGANSDALREEQRRLGKRVSELEAAAAQSQVAASAAPQPPLPSPSAPTFTARQVIDLATDRIVALQDLAIARSRLADLVRTLSTHGHMFPDNTFIQMLGGRPSRIPYQLSGEGQRLANEGRFPERLRHTGLVQNNEYNFDLIERHAKHLWDGSGKEVWFWPGGRNHDKDEGPDEYERQVIEAHHAIWKAEAALKAVEERIDKLGK